MSGRSASRVEVACTFTALVTLGAGIIGLAGDVWPWVTTGVVALSYAAVSLMLVRGLVR